MRRLKSCKLTFLFEDSNMKLITKTTNTFDKYYTLNLVFKLFEIKV